MIKKIIIVSAIAVVVLGLFFVGLQRRQFDGFSAERGDRTASLGLGR